jgi:hypothetical protein
MEVDPIAPLKDDERIAVLEPWALQNQDADLAVSRGGGDDAVQPDEQPRRQHPPQLELKGKERVRGIVRAVALAGHRLSLDAHVAARPTLELLPALIHQLSPFTLFESSSGI